jgi:hypothetical protein
VLLLPDSFRPLASFSGLSSRFSISLQNKKESVPRERLHGYNVFAAFASFQKKFLSSFWRLKGEKPAEIFVSSKYQTVLSGSKIGTFVKSLREANPNFEIPITNTLKKSL